MPLRPTITVPQPCHESWATMTPAAQGRHCASCDKVVVDFTRMTDAELLAFLRRQPATSCGRFTAQQLNRPLLVPVEASPWRRWLAAAALALGLGEVVASSVRAQTPVSQLGQQSEPDTRGESSSVILVSEGNLTTDQFTLHGVVVDSVTQQPLPGVTIIVQGTDIGVASGANGRFELLLRQIKPKHPPKVGVSTIGYMPQQFVATNLSQEYRIALAPDTRLMGEVVVAGGISLNHPIYTPRGIWQRVIQLFR